MFICEKDMHCVEMDCPIYNPEETCDHMIEVEPVKRGSWVRGEVLGFKAKTMIYCSSCKREAFYSEYGAERFAFCPYCEAFMKGTENV